MKILKAFGPGSKLPFVVGYVCMLLTLVAFLTGNPYVSGLVVYVMIVVLVCTLSLQWIRTSDILAVTVVIDRIPWWYWLPGIAMVGVFVMIGASPVTKDFNIIVNVVPMVSYFLLTFSVLGYHILSSRTLLETE